MASNNEVPEPSAQPGVLPVSLGQKELEEAISKALAGFFPSSKSVATGSRAQFFELHKRESDEFDNEFMKKYDSDANTTVILAGLFSAVASAFLIDAEKNLQPDYAQVSAALLQILVYKVNNATFSSADFSVPTWNGPTQTMVNVQLLLYASLAASLMAAFGTIIGKQWVRRYYRADNHGSLVNRSRDRQRKLDGLMRWHFEFIMETLPLILQSALLFLGLALSLYLWTIFTRIGILLIFLTSLVVTFYVTVIMCGILWYDCPFQTLPSTLIHALIEYDNEHSRYISAIYKGLHHTLEKCSSGVTQAGNRFRRLIRADVETPVPEVELEWHTEMLPLFTKEKDTNWSSHIADAHCIYWIQETSTDTDVAIATTQFISEVEWHSGIVATPSLDKLWNDFASCYDPAPVSGRMIDETRDEAYDTLKAFTHLYTQRRCVDDICMLKGLDRRTLLPYIYHPILKSQEISSTVWLLLGIIDNRFYPLHDHVPGVSIQHLAWMLHITPYRLLQDESVRDSRYIHRFIQKVLERDQRPSILVDCFLVIGLTIGLPVHLNDLMVVDKSARLDDVVRMFFKQITWGFEHSVSLKHLDWTIDALETLTYCQNPPECVSVVCYDLCRRILGSKIEERMKWKASQLVMQVGFRHSPSALLVDDYEGWPVTGLNFLEHQFALEHPEESDYDTTADIFSALSNVYPEDDVDLTKSFLSGMIASLQVDRLKPQIIRFICIFRRQIFNAGVEAMFEEEKRIFLSTISSEVDTELGKYYCRDILIYAIMSDVWRRYLGLEHLCLLESLVSSFGFGPYLRDVEDDTRLIPALADENLLNGAILKTWLQVIWLHLHARFPDSEISQQAQSAIKELFMRRPDLMDYFRTAINVQTQNELYQNYPDPDGMQRARDKIEEICKDVSSTINLPEYAELHAPSTSLV